MGYEDVATQTSISSEEGKRGCISLCLQVLRVKLLSLGRNEIVGDGEAVSTSLSSGVAMVF